MKSVMRSIKPYNLYRIMEGLKGFEFCKSRPKSEEWDGFVFLYCSKDKQSFELIPDEYKEKYRAYLGKVACSFYCDTVFKVEYSREGNDEWYDFVTEKLFRTMVRGESLEVLKRYLGEGGGFAWHISDLRCYKTPIRLDTFCHPCVYYTENPDDFPCESCEYMEHIDDVNMDCLNVLKRPPQSWCYIQSVS